jgi:quercetin dioxygenase-like cupin family protein
MHRRCTGVGPKEVAFDQASTCLPLVVDAVDPLQGADQTDMPTLIEKPSRITAAGNKPKLLDEFIGRVNSKHTQMSVAHMRSPAGWVEPGQTPEFEEYTIVLRGLLRVESKQGAIDVRPGQAIIAHPGEWVRYSTPDPEGAEYIAICAPAFSPSTVHRDA